MTLGEFVAFMAYLNYLYNPLSDVIDSLCSAQEATAGDLPDAVELELR